MIRHIEPLAEPADAMLDRVERRVAGRRMADELAGLIGDDVRDPHFMDSLCEKLRAQAFPPESQQPEQPQCEPIGRLGATVMPFGQHAGKSFDEVDLCYLDWLCRSQEEFYRTLRAYLKHPDLESRRRGLDRNPSLED